MKLRFGHDDKGKKILSWHKTEMAKKTEVPLSDRPRSTASPAVIEAEARKLAEEYGVKYPTEFEILHFSKLGFGPYHRK